MINKILPWVGIFLFIIIWYIISKTIFLNTAFIDSPQEVFKALIENLISLSIWKDIFATLFRTMIGIIFSIIIGVPLGLIIGYFSIFYISLQALIDFIRSIPATAILPLFVLCIGVGDMAKITFVIYSNSLIIIFYTMLGVRGSSKARQDYAKTVNTSKINIFRKIVFYESLPSTCIGIRTSISLSLILVIVSEMLMSGSEYGLGVRIFNARYSAEYTNMYAYIIICGLIGYSLNKGIKTIIQKFIHWTEW